MTTSPMRVLAAFACGAATFSAASSANALIPTAVGGRPGETDISVRVSLERGLIEPNENQKSWQRAKWNMYTLDAGHNFGDVGPFRDFFVRLGYTFVNSPAEVNERSDIAPGDCRGEALSPTRCQFYPANQFHVLNPAVGWNFVHEGDFAFGVFFQGGIPVGLDHTKFANPRIDYFGGGTAVGTRLRPWLSYESRLYFGSGIIESPRRQNATVAIINVFGLEAPRWLLPWKVGIKFGPYFDADLTERFDDRYDAAYTPAYATGNRDRIRMMRFAAAFFPDVQITEHGVLEVSYVQKLFGYDTPATQFLTIGGRVAF